ncbi:MAG: DUF134 domain-containing protein [bacterium]
MLKSCNLLYNNIYCKIGDYLLYLIVAIICYLLYFCYEHTPIMEENRMPRPKKCRKLCCRPNTNCFKPQGIPMSELTEIILERDEFEAIKHSDLDNIPQEEAAFLMQISRQTFGRILKSAHQKIALSIINGYALTINN